MRTSRLLGLLTAAVVALAPLTLAPPVPAADTDTSTGRLVVQVRDWNGDPLRGALSIRGGESDAGADLRGVTEYDATVPVGSYSIVSLTAWGGLLCAGVSTCDYLAIVTGSNAPDGSVRVASGETTAVELTATRPAALPRTARVGRPLTIDYSPGMDNLRSYLRSVDGDAYLPTAVWRAGGTELTGGADGSYTPQPRDAGRRIAVRLEYLGAARTQFEQITGGPVAPAQIGSAKVRKVATSAFATLGRSTVRATTEGLVRVEVTAPGLIVTGKVRVTVGDHRRVGRLRNGTARVVLPLLAPGRHTVRTRYLGSRTYARSTAKAKTLTVLR